jgi:hypothetical protein
MHKILPANAVEVGHNTENFILIFRFQGPDGTQETVYISTSPAGAKTTLDLLGKELQDYETEVGHTVNPWNHNTTQKPNGHSLSS